MDGQANYVQSGDSIHYGSAYTKLLVPIEELTEYKSPAKQDKGPQSRNNCLDTMYSGKRHFGPVLE